MHIFISVEPYQPMEYEQPNVNQLVIDCQQIENRLSLNNSATDSERNRSGYVFNENSPELDVFFTEIFRQTHRMIAGVRKLELLVEVFFIYHSSRLPACYLAERLSDLLKINRDKVYKLYNDIA